MGWNGTAEAQSAMPTDPNEVAALLQTALYDTGGETVEGAFVDRWESYAHNAVDALREIFERRGFSEADAALLRQAVSKSGAPLEAALTLVSELGRWMLPLLEAMLDDPLPRVRLVAVRALGNGRTWWLSGRPFDPAALLRGLEDTDAAVREATVQTLAQPTTRQKVAQAETFLTRALDDEDPRVRIAAGSHLNFLNRPEAADDLLRCLEREPDDAVRQALLLSVARQIQAEGVHSGYGGRRPLRERIGEPLLALVLRALTNAKPEVRQQVASALHRVDGTDVAAALLERLQQEENPDVRCAFLHYPDYQYCQIADQSLPALSALLTSDPSPAVRVQAIWVLYCCGERALPLLISALDNPNGGVKVAAARVLGMKGDRRALPALERALPHATESNLRHELLTAIREVTTRGSKSGPPML